MSETFEISCWKIVSKYNTRDNATNETKFGLSLVYRQVHNDIFSFYTRLYYTCAYEVSLGICRFDCFTTAEYYKLLQRALNNTIQFYTILFIVTTRRVIICYIRHYLPKSRYVLCYIVCTAIALGFVQYCSVNATKCDEKCYTCFVVFRADLLSSLNDVVSTRTGQVQVRRND